MKQPLAVFQQPQLLRERNLDIRVRADAEPPASADEVGRVEKAVAEVGLGDRA